METPQEVVERELALWRLSQRDPDIMNGETLQEAERRRAYMMELQEASRRYRDEAIARARDAEDELRALMRERRDWAVMWNSQVWDYLPYVLPRITWRDLWLALWRNS